MVFAALHDFTNDVLADRPSSMGFSFEDVILSALASLGCATFGEITQLDPEFAATLSEDVKKQPLNLKQHVSHIHREYPPSFNDKREPEFRFLLDVGKGFGKPCTNMGPDGVARTGGTVWVTVSVKLYHENVPTKTALAGLETTDMKRAFQRYVLLCLRCRLLSVLSRVCLQL